MRTVSTLFAAPTRRRQWRRSRNERGRARLEAGAYRGIDHATPVSLHGAFDFVFAITVPGAKDIRIGHVLDRYAGPVFELFEVIIPDSAAMLGRRCLK